MACRIKADLEEAQLKDLFLPGGHAKQKMMAELLANMSSIQAAQTTVLQQGNAAPTSNTSVVRSQVCATHDSTCRPVLVDPTHEVATHDCSRRWA